MKTGPKLVLFNRVREFRLSHDLSIDQLAKEVLCTRSLIDAIECYNYEPCLHLALRLAAFFDCSVNDLFYLDWDCK